MSETSATPTTRADNKKSAREWSLNVRREFILLWTILAALSLVVLIARTPAYNEALAAATPSADQAVDLAVHGAMAIGFILSTTLLAKAAMTYLEQLLKEVKATAS